MSSARDLKQKFASHVTASGTNRRFAATQKLGRFRSEADMAGPAAGLVADENDPNQTKAAEDAPSVA
jgi:hypothetical protein